MGNLDSSSIMQLLIAFVIVGMIVLIVDIVIVIRWAMYKIELQSASRYLAPFAASPPAELPGTAAATPATEVVEPGSLEDGFTPEEAIIPPVMEDAPVSLMPAPAEPSQGAPPILMVRPPFAATWSVVDPFMSFQAIFVFVQVVATIFLLPAMFGGSTTTTSVGGPHTAVTPAIRGPIRPNAPHGTSPHPSADSGPRSGAPARPGNPAVPTTSPAAAPVTPVMNADGLYSPYGLGVQITALILQNVLFVIVTAFFVRKYGSSLKAIGLRKPTGREIALGIGLGAAMFLFAAGCEKGLSAALVHISPALAERLTKLTEAITAGGMFEKIHGNGWKLAFVLTGAIAAPIGEEVFFRGFLYNTLKKRWGILVGVLVSGLAFALIHLGPLAVVVIFPMGVALAYTYERTRSLWVTIFMHIVNNGTAFVLAWFFGGK